MTDDLPGIDHLPEHLRGHPLIKRGYRANVAAVVRRGGDGRLLWCERIDIEDSWQFPQGGVDPGEDALEALWRELGEELGVAAPREVMTLAATAAEPIRYRFPNRVLERWVRRRKHTWLGQAQRYFLLDFHGPDAAITLEPPAGQRREFSRWCWDGVERLERAPGFKRAALTAGLRALGLRVSGDG